MALNPDQTAKRKDVFILLGVIYDFQASKGKREASHHAEATTACSELLLRKNKWTIDTMGDHRPTLGAPISQGRVKVGVVVVGGAWRRTPSSMEQTKMQSKQVVVPTFFYRKIAYTYLYLIKKTLIQNNYRRFCKEYMNFSKLFLILANVEY